MMRNLDGLLFGSLVLAFAVLGVRASLFKIRHYREWPTRWPEATPTIRWMLLSELFTRALVRDRLAARSRREAILGEAPALLLFAVLIGGAFWLIAVGPP